MKSLTQTIKFLSSWKNWTALGTLLPLGTWIYSRVWSVNPAILGDEYLYSMNARKAAPWDPSPAGDFSNYLFNFVYQGTNLCGEGFYTCAKVFNIFFFLSFVFTLFIVATRFLPFWAAYGFMIASGLSPLSVYTSMFLPESMYMFFIGLLLIAVLHAMKDFTWQNWAMVGAAIGIASLVKPHAWLSAIAVGITLLVVGLGSTKVGIKGVSLGATALIASAAIARIGIGVLVAGPKALGFFGQYLGFATVEQVFSGSQIEGESAVGISPMGGVFALFWTQINVHILAISALMALAVVALAAGVLEIVKSKKLSAVTSFALFSFIWLFSLMAEIVIFTGWVTGSGDDHTTRVLLRYYEFLFVIVPLAGLAVLRSEVAAKVNLWVRWLLGGGFALLITPAFSGFFATLTIQIADAPTLAGLVVNANVFNSIALIGFASLLTFATFPRYSAWAFACILPFSMIATGWQIQDQYQAFRGVPSSNDKAGFYLRDNLSQEEIGSTWIVANSRFDATNIAFWADNPDVSYELFAQGTQLSKKDLPEQVRFVLATGDITFDGPATVLSVNKSFTLYELR